jgi:hypothetical protein
MKKVIVKIAQIQEEHKRAFSFLHNTFKKAFGFDYEKVAATMPPFEKVVFYTVDEEDNMLSTATLSYPNIEGKYCSEVLLDFKTPDEYKNQRLVELGRFAKNQELNGDEKFRKLPFLGLLLGIKAYAQKHQIDGWIGSVYSGFFNGIESIGIPLTELACGVHPEDEKTLHRIIYMGDYLKDENDIHFVYSKMEDAYRALDKFDYLLINGIIELEIESESNELVLA